MQFGVHVLGDVFDVVWLLGLPHQEALRAMRSEVVFRKKMRVPRSHDALTSQKACIAVIRVQSVLLPRIVAQHNLGLTQADHPGHLSPCGQTAIELPIYLAEEVHLPECVGSPSRKAAGCFDLLHLTTRRKGRHVGGRIPGAF
jgi:hypothetical protein